MTFTLKKTTRFKSVIAATNAFCALFEKQNGVSSLGMLLHKGKNIYHEKTLEFFVFKDAGVNRRTIINPLYKGLGSPLRDRIHNVMCLDATPATQSQLFAMIRGNNADAKWMKQFLLKDRQKMQLYRWQETHFNEENNHSPEELLHVARNIVNFAKLPPLPITFEEEGKSCFFSFSMAGGGVLDSESVKKQDSSDIWGWLRRANDTSYEKIGQRTEASSGVRISAMRLTIQLSWALTAPIIIHEICHYIDFITPNPYRINQGKHRLSFRDYEHLFAGHGASYTSIFARALIDFYGVDEQEMYESLKAADLWHFWIKSIAVKDIIEGMDHYVEQRLKS
ncbi:hypothetical protein [Alteromonas sp. 14N.309.X.WAT.G.H12]|uniref:hypothetical protein n=1 Tax=Alteromonas sp. 14N.309.X.WAT.G.H12 TaxID=3120824 RepID=UPI002FD74C6A